MKLHPKHKRGEMSNHSTLDPCLPLTPEVFMLHPKLRTLTLATKQWADIGASDEATSSTLNHETSATSSGRAKMSDPSSGKRPRQEAATQDGGSNSDYTSANGESSSISHPQTTRGGRVVKVPRVWEESIGGGTRRPRGTPGGASGRGRGRGRGRGNAGR